MSAWLIRPYPHNTYRRDEFLKDKMIAVGWPQVGSVDGLDEEGLEKALSENYPDKCDNKKWFSDAKAALASFSSEMQEGDLVLVVPKMSDMKGRVMLCRVAGEYEFKKELANERQGYPHQRPVQWLRPMIDRSFLPDSLKPSLRKQGLTLAKLPEGMLEACAEEQGWVPA